MDPRAQEYRARAHIREKKGMNIRFVSIALLTASLVGCAAPGPKAIAVPKFACLLAPSGSFRAGTVIRTIDAASPVASAIAPDDLVIAYSPLGAPQRYDYADIEQSVVTGATAALTGKVLERIGIVLDVSGGANYSVILTAKDNSDYTADDDLRKATFEKLKATSGLIDGAQYFFIKEALGSQNISYEVKRNADVKGKALIKADSSGLSADIKFIDSKTSITGQKKDLIACVVLEEIKVVRAANGQEFLNALPVRSDSPAIGIIQGVSKTK